jgi:coenzyme F420-reducing hydrogenase delta subunit
MGVGPPGRTGRDQLAAVKEFVECASPKPDDIVLVGCAHSAARSGEALTGAPLLRVSCAGNLHTSVVEYLVRAGAGGVMVVSCPPRDCWNREGVKWLAERLYNERAAELKDRVDRRRLRVTHASEGQAGSLVREVERFRAEVRSLERTLGESSIELNPECDLPAISVAQEGGS